jgi:hypothetical protein
MTSNAVTAGFTFLYNTLTADSTFMSYVSGVYTGIAPEGSLPDYAIVIHQAGPKTLAATGQLIMTRTLFQVKITGPEADYDGNITSAYDRMVTLLGLVRSTSGILACYLEQDLYINEVVDGVPWINLGGLFRVEI